MDTLEGKFQRQKAWIARCEDVQELLDRMVGYRRDLQAGVRNGDALLRMRASDLLELAEDRVVELKAQRVAAAAKAAAPVPPPPPAPPVESPEAAEVRRLREELAMRDRREGDRRTDQETRRRVAWEARIEEQRQKEEHERQVREDEEQDRARRLKQEESAATARLTNAQAAEVEARAMLIRARAHEAQRGNVAEPVRQVRVATPAPTATRTAAVAPSTQPVARPSRPVVVERETPKATKPVPPPAPMPTATAPTVSVDALPAYTGRDLADYRLGHGLTQRAIAAMLGVEQGTVCKGEGRPGAVLGPTLRAAFHRLVVCAEGGASALR